MRAISLALLLSFAPVVATAQDAPMGLSVPDSVYQHALRLVTDGNGADGRAIVDSLLRVLPEGSMDYGEALYWRSALATTAAEAERGYLRLTVEYPLSPRVEEALLRLGQLEQTRGNKALALSRYERAAAEFPGSPRRAHTQLQIARIYLEENRLREGCNALVVSRGALQPTDVELRTQVDYHAQRCVGIAAQGAATPSAAATPAADVRVVRPAPATSVPAATAPVVSATAAPAPAASTAAARTPAAPAPAAEPAPRPRVITPPHASEPAPRAVPASRASERAPDRAARPSESAAAPRAGTRPAPGFSVQVGAFDTRASAEALVAQLRRKGHEARIDAEKPWFRVRVGHWTTRADADAAAKRLKAEGVSGFVAPVGGR